MVNMQRVRERLMKGLFVGVGAFSSSFIGTMIENNLGTGDVGTAAAQIVVGAGVSVGVDEVFTNPAGMPNDFFEFMGYGVQGAGWSNIASGVQTGAHTGASTVRVSGGSTGARSGGSSGGQTGQTLTGSDFSLET